MIKYIFWLLCSLVVAVLVGSMVYAAPPEPFPYQDVAPAWSNAQPWSIKDQAKLAVIDTQWPIQRLIRVFLPNRPAGEWVVQYIQYILNLALSLVAFIAVIILIYGFYGILFGDSQEGITNAQKTVKWAVIAIIIMWASWIIVQAMFYIITKLQ